jgi:DNA-binding beta-propeller fold protein YncE
MGHCEFDDVVVTVAKGTDWHITPHGKVTPEWVNSLALLPDGSIVYPVRNMNRIQVITPDGKLVREFGQFGREPGQLYMPSAVATDATGNIYVTESGNKRVQVFDSAGNSRKVIAPTDKDALLNPSSITVEPSGRIWVCDSDPNRPRVVCFSPDGAVIASVGTPAVPPNQPATFNGPQHINFIQGKVYVADSGNGRLMIIDAANPAAPPVARPITGGVLSIAFNGKDTYALCQGWTVQFFDANLNPIPNKVFTGGALGGLCANQCIFDKDGNVLIADGWFHRIVMVPPSLTDVKPEITNITDSSAVVTWSTDVETPTKLMLLDTPQGSVWDKTADYSKAKAFGDGAMVKDHRVALTELKSATRHCLAIASPFRTIPSGSQSVDFRFITRAPRGKMMYTEVPIAILVYGNVVFDAEKGPDGKVQPPSVRTHEWFEQCIKAHEAMRYFFWINSFMQLDTQCKYLFVTRPVDWAYLGSSSEEVYKDLATLAKRENLTPEDFGAVLVVGGNGTYAYPWPTPWWGGKLTYTTGCCFAGGGDVWLSTHEFHHCTEGWMHMIGAPGYICADFPWTGSGRYGENFDFLGWTLRTMPHDTYVNLSVGKIRTTDDKDGDGVPDDDPRCPWDEKRAGTDPTTAETYQNGLTDLENLTAETFTPAVRGLKNPLLTKRVDLKYPFAVFNYNYERPKKTPVIDGMINPGEWDVFVTKTNTSSLNPNSPVAKAWQPPAGARYEMTVYLNWDDNYLYYAAKAPYKFSMGTEMDCNGDGYFHGNDNPRMYFSIPWDEADPKTKANTLMPPPGVMVWNNVEPVAQFGGPNWTNDRFPKENQQKIKWMWGKTADGQYLIEAAIPRTDAVGLIPAEGKEMGVRLYMVGYLPPTEKNPTPTYAFEMFESCEYGYFKLVK